MSTRLSSTGRTLGRLASKAPDQALYVRFWPTLPSLLAKELTRVPGE